MTNEPDVEQPDIIPAGFEVHFPGKDVAPLEDIEYVVIVMDRENDVISKVIIALFSPEHVEKIPHFITHRAQELHNEGAVVTTAIGYLYTNSTSFDGKHQHSKTRAEWEKFLHWKEHHGGEDHDLNH